MTDTIYQLPTWAETILVVCVALMLSGIAAFLLANSACSVIDAESRLERKRRDSEATALDKWKSLYEEEKRQRISAVSDLMDEIYDLRRENARMKSILERAKVKDL